MILRNPNFGNTFSVDTQVLVRSTLDGGQTNTVKRWPNIKGFSVTISNLSKDQRDEFIAFLISTAGQKIVMVDHEGTSWTGFIITNPVEFFQTGRGCKHEVSYQFESIV